MNIRRRAVWGVVLGHVLAAWAGPAEPVISLEEAAQRIGEEVTFEAEVQAAASSPRFKATYANFGDAYPRQTLSVLFAGA